MNHKRATTEQALKLLDGQPVSSSLPHKFEDTGFAVATVDFRCAKCEANLKNTEVHGYVSSLIPNVLDFDVVGKCPICGVLTPFRLRINSNRVCDWYHAETHTWKRFKIYQPNSKGVKTALRDLLSTTKSRFFAGQTQ